MHAAGGTAKTDHPSIEIHLLPDDAAAIDVELQFAVKLPLDELGFDHRIGHRSEDLRVEFDGRQTVGNLGQREFLAHRRSSWACGRRASLRSQRHRPLVTDGHGFGRQRQRDGCRAGGDVGGLVLATHDLAPRIDGQPGEGHATFLATSS